MAHDFPSRVLRSDNEVRKELAMENFKQESKENGTTHHHYVQKARESVTNYGAEHCDLHEVLAVIIGDNANPDVCANLSRFDIHLLAEMTIQELCEIPGVTYEVAASIKGAFGLVKKLSTRRKLGASIRIPRHAVDLVMEELRYLKQEHFICLFLNLRGMVIEKKTIFIGSVDASVIHAREIFKEAVKLSSSFIVCIHTHPSADPSPSREDIELTNNLQHAGNIIGIPLFDHIIIGDGSYFPLFLGKQKNRPDGRRTGINPILPTTRSIQSIPRTLGEHATHK